ncbi:GerMN domain-containing protein [Promicromonospora panici]|uniref:GerMN domain-containing protein n=1 Tax=Promicromonospora panici TaxID=2219658 RepID=UPI00101D2FC2|nr:LpqB family beta-propeller domain-containing protein [Promicromonospora panici]
MRRAATVAVAAVVTLSSVAGLGACAQIPTSGPVRVGNADIDTQVDIAMLPQGPSLGADPQVIVAGFLGAVVAATTSPKEFQTAREFLTDDVAAKWDPEASVRVVREAPVPAPVERGVELKDTDTVEVVVRATTIATVDSAGAYTEVGDPRELGYRFTLVKSGGEWRISALDDGVLVPANLFANQYRATRLFFPAESDPTSLVPDLRWFPRRTWRNVAVEELLAGPPEWLQGAARSLVPEGTQLSSPSVRDTDGEEAVAVRLSEQISTAPAEERAVIAAQLSATLSEGAGRVVPVDLYSGQNRLSVDTADVNLPATLTEPMALKDDALYLVADGALEPWGQDAGEPLDLSGMNPTALAISPATEPIVLRDGDDQIWDLTAEDGPVSLFEGPDLAAPSVDKFAATWTSGGSGELRVAPEVGSEMEEVTLKPEWLSGRKVISVSVAPEGSRVAIVSEAPTGTQVHVAGVVRNHDDVPVALAAPLSVAAPIDDIVEARWAGITTLALLTEDNDGVTGVWTAGVGGLAGAGGAARQLPGLTDVEQLAAGVADPGMLVITEGGHLEHEETGVWQPFDEDVELVAFPG